ncbi:hypothetical protein [Lacticaseibacillus hegangensis]|uniref:Uncharacterized protein n=1 Tax=Lacticaseibacillus hegangensis TaxID=2486010 RepID=A0ABW4CUQ6_9LACO|nr:hypothetical protein [Lacticaseibacillus hegangensis]
MMKTELNVNAGKYVDRTGDGEKMLKTYSWALKDAHYNCLVAKNISKRARIIPVRWAASWKRTSWMHH